MKLVFVLVTFVKLTYKGSATSKIYDETNENDTEIDVVKI